MRNRKMMAGGTGRISGALLAILFLAASGPRSSVAQGLGQMQPGEASVVRIQAQRAGLREFRMNTVSSGGNMVTNAFTATLGGGAVSGQGTVNWSNSSGPQQMNIQLANVDAMALLKAFGINFDGRVNARSNAQMELSWAGMRGNSPRRTMSGIVHLQFGAGTVTDAYVLKQIAQVTGISAFQAFSFNSGIIEGTIRQGIMQISSADFVGEQQRGTGTGTLSIPNETLDLSCNLYVAPSFIQQSTSNGVKAAGAIAGLVTGEGGKNKLMKLPVPVLISGKLSDPQFHVLPGQQQPKTEKSKSGGKSLKRSSKVKAANE